MGFYVMRGTKRRAEVKGSVGVSISGAGGGSARKEAGKVKETNSEG